MAVVGRHRWGKVLQYGDSAQHPLTPVAPKPASTRQHAQAVGLSHGVGLPHQLHCTRSEDLHIEVSHCNQEHAKDSVQRICTSCEAGPRATASLKKEEGGAKRTKLSYEAPLDISI